MNPKSYLLPAIILLIGMATGWILRGPRDLNPTAEEQPNPTNPAARQIGGSPGNMERRLPSENAAPETPHDPIGEAETLQVSPESLAALLAVPVIDLERRTQLVLTDEPLARFLELQDEETAALNEAWRQIRPRLDALRVKNAQSQRLDDGGMWIGIERFPEEGEALRLDFLLTTHAVLGENRGKVFLDVIKAHGAFGQWGKTVGSGYAVRVRVQQNGSPLYEITEQARADGSPGKTWQAATIPSHLQDLAKAAGIALTP